jgi:cyclopropane fatty-acyl-phospholipid synthase-like methyltransferase
MLQMAALHEGDVLYDLGSGDGRIPIMAARRYGIEAVGIDIDPRRIEEATAHAQTAGVGSVANFSM